MGSSETRGDVAQGAMRTIVEAVTSERESRCAYLLEEAVWEAIWPAACQGPVKGPEHRAAIVQAVQRLSNELAALVDLLSEED